ncbi:hypothetical protein BTR22_06930 [Alkalihalophilus pseudofirmus]|uniref:HEAT repeat domain-containing protein n=1 Tax=Alkalihalophilus pseudofirmus TaxID=79885 RepID=UPI00095361E2|nr:hypothetical protein BTR22_06930 [Alkalihalophilus pseudofirmus]
MIELAICFIILLVVIQLSLLVYLFIRKTKDLSFERKITTAYNELINPTIAYITEETMEEPRWPTRALIKSAVLERMLNEIAATTKKESELARISTLAETHLTPKYQKDLKKGSWSSRVNALYFIEDLYIYSMKNHVWERLLSIKKKDEEYRQALRTLSTLKDDRVITFLINEEQLPKEIIADVFRRLPISALELLKNKVDEGALISDELIHSFISFCGENSLYEFLPFVENKLTSQDVEIRIKSLRSLCYYQYCSNPEQLTNFFTSPFWEERMFAARLTGIMLLTQYSSILKELAGDSVWWVRYTACEAIKKMPDGEIILEFMAAKHQDSFARDMARQSITLGEGRK